MHQSPYLCGCHALHGWAAGRLVSGGGDRPVRLPEAVSRVYAVAYRLTGTAADAEAVTRNALLQFDTPLDDSGDPARLYRLTVNAVHARRRSVVVVRGRRSAAAPPGGDMLARLEAAVAALPPEYRDPFVLTDIEGLSDAEVADLLRLTVPAMQSRLHRARLLLCAALRDAG